jgi:hypothetical protein
MEHPGGYEKQDISVKKVAIWTAILIFLLSLSFVALDDWFIKTKEEMYEEMVLKPVNQELIDLRAKEDSLLSSYGKFDTLGGVYRIPIDSAMIQMAAESGSTDSK